MRPKEGPGRRQDGPQTAQGRPTAAPTRPRTPKDGPQEGPGGPQRGSRTAFGRPQDGAQRPQDGPRRLQDVPRRPPPGSPWVSEHGRCLLDFGVDFGRILIPSACIRIRPKNTYRRLQNLGFPKRDISRRRVPLGACIKEGVRVDLSNACFLGLRESLLAYPKPAGRVLARPPEPNTYQTLPRTFPQLSVSFEDPSAPPSPLPHAPPRTKARTTL